MEQEIDVRPFLLALVRQWKIILGLSILAALAAILIVALMPQANVADADVFIVPTTSQVTLDERFTTNEATQITNASFQREALLALASSSTFEMRVLDQLPAGFLGQPFAPGMLLSQVNVSSQGDLIRVKATGATDEDALTLAETWAKTYEQVVNELYSRSSGQGEAIETQTADARQRYDAAQQALENFIGTSSQIRVDQQVKGIQALLDGSREGDQLLYTQYLTRTRELESIINDAQTVRQQLETGSTDELGNILSSLALRSRVAGGQDLPIDLRFDNPEALARSNRVTPADIDKLISVLQQRHEELLGTAQQLAKAIAGGTGTSSGLPSALRQQYEQQLDALYQQQETLTAQRNALQQSRDIAFSSLEVLQRKSDEDRIAQTSPQVEVRFVNAALVPPSSRLVRAAIAIVLGGVLGFIAGAIVALFLEIVRPRLRTLGRSAQQGDRPIDRPAAS